MRRRYQDWDFLRAVFLLLGLLLHAAFWCQDRSLFAEGIVTVVRSFRMPGFFLVGGFFAALTLSRNSPAEFLKKRSIRLGIPFLTVFLLSFPLAYLWEHWMPFAAGPENSRHPFVLVSHLWFLTKLLLFALLLYGLHLRFPNGLAFIQKPWNPIALLSILGIANLVLQTSARWASHLSWAFQIRDPRFFGLYFASGYLMFHQRTIFSSRLADWRFAATVVMGYWGILLMSAPDSGFLHKVSSLLNPAYIFAVCSLFLDCANRFSAVCSRLQPFAAASYTIYLLHFPVQVIANSAISPFALNPLLHMSILVAVGLLISFGFHVLVVRRFASAGFLFNGESGSAAPAPAPGRIQPLQTFANSMR